MSSAGDDRGTAAPPPKCGLDGIQLELPSEKSGKHRKKRSKLLTVCPFILGKHFPMSAGCYIWNESLLSIVRH